jgi:bifunctional UDP-N-acetylglucosamine pyrophosphorylase/glucosamine-1-phosphate N-acetyltransferase
VLTAVLDDPARYGRILRQGGAVQRIVEYRDASPEERAILEINTGFLAAPAELLSRLLPRVGNRNAQKEYYLTDVIGLAAQAGLTIADCQAVPDEILGVNSRRDLASLEDTLRKRRAAEVLEQGVSLLDPGRFDLRGELIAGIDVEIDINVILEGRVELGDRVRIGPNCVIRNSTIGSDTTVRENCVIEEASVGEHCVVGPFARVRPGSEFAEHVHIGNFVETKKAQVARGSKINHLSYIGDAEIGSGVNIGAGTITCNYDGVAKHRTRIGDGAFIGSGTQLVAPVRVGRGATVGAGTTVTRDVPDDELVLSRTRQKVVPGWHRPGKKG